MPAEMLQSQMWMLSAGPCTKFFHHELRRILQASDGLPARGPTCRGC